MKKKSTAKPAENPFKDFKPGVYDYGDSCVVVGDKVPAPPGGFKKITLISSDRFRRTGRFKDFK